MSVDETLLKILVDSGSSHHDAFSLHLGGKEYVLSDVVVSHLPTPVNEPTTRGGVYFSDKFAYKMRGSIRNLSVVPHLTKKMLGPNTEFVDMKIFTKVISDNAEVALEIRTNLTNSVQTPNSIELSMIVVGLKPV